MDATTGGGDRGARIVKLRRELSLAKTCSFFATTEELARLVTAAITIALEARTAADIDTERRERAVESERQGRREGQRVVGRRVFDAGSLFRDRVEYRRELGRLLAEPATRIVSVLGRPGIGKTALAATVLAELEQGRWPHAAEGLPVDGIAYLNASREPLTLETLYHHCALMLGGSREVELRGAWRDSRLTTEDKVERLLQALEGGLYIVLLDHLDSLLDDEARLVDPDLRVFVERALLAPRRTRLLLTSRASLALSPQARPFHRHVTLDTGLPIPDGIAFLRDLDPDGVLHLRDLPDESLGRAVERLHGVPRALELLVALVQRDVFRSLDEILEGFYRSPDVLNELVRAAFQRLDAEERLVVNILAILERPVRKHVVEFMVRPFTPGLAVDRVLSDLVQARMVKIDRDTGLLSLSAIDHDYALSELPSEGEGGRRALGRQAAAYYATLQVPRPRWRSLLDVEPQLLQTTHLVRAADFAAAAAVLTSIDVEFVFWTGAIGRVQALLRELEGRVDDLGLQGRCRYRVAQVITFVGPLSEVFGRLADAEALARQASDPELERLVVGWRGEVCRRLSRVDEAVQYLRRATEIYKKNDVPLRDYFPLSLSLAYAYQRRPANARWWAERMRALIVRHDQQATYTGQVEDALALVALVACRFADAVEYARRAIECYRSIDAHDPRGYVSNVWGMALLSLGQVTDAIGRFQEIRRRESGFVGRAGRGIRGLQSRARVSDRRPSRRSTGGCPGGRRHSREDRGPRDRGRHGAGARTGRRARRRPSFASASAPRVRPPYRANAGSVLASRPGRRGDRHRGGRASCRRGGRGASASRRARRARV